MFFIRAIAYGLVRFVIYLAIMAAYLALCWVVLLRFDNEIIPVLIFCGFGLVFSLTITVLEKWQWGDPMVLYRNRNNFASAQMKRSQGG